MFQLGDQVVYGIHGVCQVADFEERVVDRKRQNYLVLEPVGQEGSRYLVPMHNEVAMGKLRRMLSAPEMEALIQSPDLHELTWVRDENQRKQTYRELIGSGNREELLKMLYTLYDHKKNQLASGKKVHQCDENFLRDAERLMSSEISIVMGLEFDQARTFLREQLKTE